MAGISACNDGSRSTPAGISPGIAISSPTPESTQNPGDPQSSSASALLWTATRDPMRVSALNPENGKVILSKDLDQTPSALLSQKDSIWIGTEQGSLLKLDRATGEIQASVALEGSIQGIVSHAGEIWVADLPGSGPSGAKPPKVIRLDEMGNVLSTIELGDIADYFGGIGANADGIWVLLNNHISLYKIDFSSAIATRQELPALSGYGHGSLSVGHDGIWIFDQYVGRVLEITQSGRGPLRVKQTAPLDKRLGPEILETEDRLIVLNPKKESLSFMDRSAPGEAHPFAFSSSPRAMCLVDGSLYVALQPRSAHSSGVIVEISLGAVPEIERSLSAVDADFLAGE